MKMITYLTTTLLIFFSTQIGLCQQTDIEHKLQKSAIEPDVDANTNETVAVISGKESIVDSSNDNPTYFPCYAVSEDDDAPNILFKFDASTGNWTEVGITGGINIEAIATDPITDIIYATDAGTFGSIDVNTALFNPIGEVGTGIGDMGLIELNDIDGLTYDPVNQIMYGTHRIVGQGPGTNDLLLQIDVATGQVISGAMLDVNNNPVDYAVIPSVFAGSFGGEAYDVDDIAYSPYAGQLLAIQNQADLSIGAITELNVVTGEIEYVIYEPDEDDIESLGITSLGELFATTGANSSVEQNSNSHILIDLLDLSTPNLGFIDPSNQYKDYEAFDCFTAYNDLAILLEEASPLQQPITVGSSVTFLLTVFNQGDYANSDITITNYIPNGLSLTDENWQILDNNSWFPANNGKAMYIFEEAIEPGEDRTIEITYTVEADFEGETITNTVEITASYSPNAIDLQGNQFPYPLPDLDSHPNDINDELTVKDNEINGGGPNANQDEDDHDIAVIQVQQVLCPAYLVIPNGEISGYFQAHKEIDIQGYVEKAKTAEFNICE